MFFSDFYSAISPFYKTGTIVFALSPFIGFPPGSNKIKGTKVLKVYKELNTRELCFYSVRVLDSLND